MGITNSIRALLNITGMKQCDLLPVFNLANVQSLSNKFREERWSASDLVKIADATGCKLCFVFPDGERIVLSSDQAAPPTGESSGRGEG